MSSIQTALLSRPLPLEESTSPGATSSKSKMSNPAHDPAKVAKDFESVFASMLLEDMRNTLEPGSLFGEDSSDIFGGMFDQFMGEHVAESGGFGLAKMVESALQKQQSQQVMPGGVTLKVH